jgi:hypothetical protein
MFQGALISSDLGTHVLIYQEKMVTGNIFSLVNWSLGELVSWSLEESVNCHIMILLQIGKLLNWYPSDP